MATRATIIVGGKEVIAWGKAHMQRATTLYMQCHKLRAGESYRHKYSRIERIIAARERERIFGPGTGEIVGYARLCGRKRVNALSSALRARNLIEFETLELEIDW